MFGELKVNKILSLTTMETPDQAVAKLLEFAEYPKSFAGSSFQRPSWFLSPTLTAPIAERSTSMTGNSASGFGWISMTRTTVGTALQNSMF